MKERACAQKYCKQLGKIVTATRNGKQFSYRQKFCTEHWGDMMRQKSRERVGDRHRDKDGYIRIRHPETGRLIAEHRFIMQKKLRRELRRGESVHHKNGIRDDNRPQNLELWVGPIRYGQRAKDIICHNCGEPYHI